MQIFISYRSTERDIVSNLSTDLEDMGHTVWYDKELSGGQDWWDGILSAIRSADLVILALSNGWLDSHPCALEFDYARELNRHVIPVQIADVNYALLSETLQSLQIVDYQAKVDRRFRNLTRAINKLPTVPDLPDPLPTPPPIPLSTLAQIAEELKQPELSRTQQAAIVMELRSALNDPTQKADAITLLQRLKNHEDVRGFIIDEVNTLLRTQPAEIFQRFDSGSNVTITGSNAMRLRKVNKADWECDMPFSFNNLTNGKWEIRNEDRFSIHDIQSNTRIYDRRYGLHNWLIPPSQDYIYAAKVEKVTGYYRYFIAVNCYNISDETEAEIFRIEESSRSLRMGLIQWVDNLLFFSYQTEGNNSYHTTIFDINSKDLLTNTKDENGNNTPSIPIMTSDISVQKELIIGWHYEGYRKASTCIWDYNANLLYQSNAPFLRFVPNSNYAVEVYENCLKIIDLSDFRAIDFIMLPRPIRLKNPAEGTSIDLQWSSEIVLSPDGSLVCLPLGFESVDEDTVLYNQRELTTQYAIIDIYNKQVVNLINGKIGYFADNGATMIVYDNDGLQTYII